MALLSMEFSTEPASIVARLASLALTGLIARHQ